MKSFLLSSFLLLLSLSLFSQEGVSLGAVGGTAHYIGDYNKTNPFYSPSLGYGLVMKTDFSKRYSVKIMAARQSLSGDMTDFDDFNYPATPDNIITKKSFYTSFWDISASVEFNFLPYDVFNIRKENFSPFVFLGVGTDYFLTEEKINFPLTIPFGLGIKYNIFERFSIGFEWNVRKIFFDSMDGVNTIEGHESELHNDDWYHMPFLFITYKPFSRVINCPTYDD
ncbi:MAG: DUF6089 family protein [Bacteroidales bacterium]